MCIVEKDKTILFSSEANPHEMVELNVIPSIEKKMVITKENVISILILVFTFYKEREKGGS